MPDITADIEYIANLPLYATEKPYLCLLPPDEAIDPDVQRLDNLEYETQEGINVTDIRGKDEFVIETCGFQTINHASKFEALKTIEDVAAYKTETEELLQEQLGAVRVLCYELRMRKNEPIKRKQFDVNDPLLVERPAKGAHNGMSYTVRYAPFANI
jgi:hypothetical protein